METNINYLANEWEKQNHYTGRNPFKRLWFFLFPKAPEIDLRKIRKNRLKKGSNGSHS